MPLTGPVYGEVSAAVAMDGAISGGRRKTTILGLIGGDVTDVLRLVHGRRYLSWCPTAVTHPGTQPTRYLKHNPDIINSIQQKLYTKNIP